MTHALKFIAVVFTGVLIGTAAFAEGVLVFGATGQLGAPHVRMLVEKGETVTAFVRPTSTRERLQGLDINYAVGDLMDVDSVIAAVREAKPRVIIDTSARRGDQMRADKPFYTQAMENIIAGAKAAGGVEQIIIHSSVGVRGSAERILTERGFDTDSPNMRDKGGAEVALENSGIGYTIIRNGLLEFEPAEPTGTGYLTQDFATLGRITRTDLSVLALDCMDNAECMGEIYHAMDTSLPGMRPERESGG